MVFTLDLRFGDILVDFWKSGHCQQVDPEVSVLGTLCVVERLKKLTSVGLRAWPWSYYWVCGWRTKISVS